MQGKSAGHARVVDDGPRRTQTLDKEYLLPLEDPELRVLTEHRVEVLHKRQGGLTQTPCRGRPRGQLPHPNTDAQSTVRGPLQQAEDDQLLDQPRGGGYMKSRATCDLADSHLGALGVEGVEYADHPRQR